MMLPHSWKETIY